MALSDRQRQMLLFIQEYVAEHGYPPTIREIGQRLGITSTSVVNYNLNKLKASGAIEREGQISRGLKLRRNPKVTLVPVLGTIAAGEPLRVFDPASIDELDEDQEMIEISAALAARSPRIYALRVKGDSMIDALVHDGDIVVLEPTDTAQDGDMVAAWIIDAEETTLKRYYNENGRIRLQPANPRLQPIYVSPDNVRVQGRVVAVIRQLA